MQFLWKYIDDLIGKGLEISVLLELLFYVSATIIPLALPIAVLFSSIMTFGNLAEHNELTALKASGVSLMKTMRPMLLFILILSASAFYFTNYVLPIANLKWRAIIWDIQEKKPTFGITEGIFYNDIENYSIRVDKKNDNTGGLEGILIYELTQKSVGKTIKAKTGEMLKSENDRYLLLKLNSGAMYEKLSPAQMQSDQYPFQKTFFEEAIIKFDLSGFQMQESSEDLFKRDFEMMNFIQLSQTIDSLHIMHDDYKSNFQKTLKNSIATFNDELNIDSVKVDSSELVNGTIPRPVPVDTVINYNDIKVMELEVARVSAQNEIRSTKDMIFGQNMVKEAQALSIEQFKTAWHKKFTLSVALIILFFIGAPLGAIIKKGGLGAPLVFATLFFLLFYVLTVMGENMVISGFFEPWKGMWMSSLYLAPLGIFLTYKAANDSALFDRDVYKRYFRKIFPSKK